MKKGTAITFAVGVFTGLALCGPAAQAADYLTARPTVGRRIMAEKNGGINRKRKRHKEEKRQDRREKTAR